MDYVGLYTKYLGPGRRSGQRLAFPCFRCDKGEIGKRHLYVDPSTGNYICYKCRFNPDGLGKGSARKFAKMVGERGAIEETAPGSYTFKDENTFNQCKANYVYTYLWRNMPLLPEHHKEITRERGISHPERFGVRSCIGAVNMLRNYFVPNMLVASGLFYWRQGSLVAHTTITDGRILIPYMEPDGTVYFLKSRRTKDDGTIKYSTPINSQVSKRIWGRILPDQATLIVTEGEFKAMAAVEARLHCVALPGMGSSHTTLIERIKESDVKHVILCFDTQTKQSENVEHTIRALARRLIREAGVAVRNAVLPLDPRLNNGEKMDLDGFLYLYDVEDLKKVFKESDPILL